MPPRRFHLRNIVAMRRGLVQHNSRCPIPADAILLNPTDHRLLGHDFLWSVPVVSDESVTVKRFKILCQGSAEGVEEALQDWTEPSMDI